MRISPRFSNNTQISNFTKIHPVAAQQFHSDRWTDMTKLKAAPFQNVANTPNKTTVKHN